MTSRLEDILHVLDEPTIGQHPADVARLLPAFRELPGPVVYVEHDRVAASVADRAIDLGPGAGDDGGRLIFTGTPGELWDAETPTGRFFSRRERVKVPSLRAEPKIFMTIRGARQHNLAGIDVPIPLGRLTLVTGVSGSGKSTLVEHILVPSLKGEPAGCDGVEGPRLKPVLVDQSPIGRNPRSNPATYTKLSDVVREYYARESGLSASHFSFNRPEGACPACKGMGAIEVKMRYLPSTWIPCGDCGGKRFSDEVLNHRVGFGDRSLSIAEFYGLPISEVRELMENAQLSAKERNAAMRILRALEDIGLGYIRLGQPSPTLSGGEAQRVKLAKYLGRRNLRDRLLILDEPSAGLHPQDLAGLLVVLDRLVRSGATIVVVEHNTDLIRAADWVVDLGPGAGPEGGRLLYAGPLEGLYGVPKSVTGRALLEEDEITPIHDIQEVEESSGVISIRDARANNLKGVDVDIPKGALTVVTGVSGSGKSSLVGDVLEAEARRRFLETLSIYERQGTREGAEAPVGSVTGLGVSVTATPDRRLYDRRSTVGTATEIWYHLAVLLAATGERSCTECGAGMERNEGWTCPACGTEAPIAEPRHFSPLNYAAACTKCQGVGSLQKSNPGKLIVRPDLPLCGGAMHSPGFFPKGYLCKPGNHGYYIVKAVLERYGFDSAETPWNEMTREAQEAFLFGDPETLTVSFRSHSGRTGTREVVYPGFYGWVRDWDIGGTYTDNVPCPDCGGRRLRPQYLAVTIGGYNIHELSEMPLSGLEGVLEGVSTPELEGHYAGGSLATARRRLGFLLRVGLGYLNLNRVSATLSAGEAQRVKLAGLLGGGLTSLTVLLDEPSRGMHPSELEALLGALEELRDEGNTVVVVEHDPVLINAADHLVDMGPGAGTQGGLVVAEGSTEAVSMAGTVTGGWLRGERVFHVPETRREPQGWLTVEGATENNLKGETVKIPLGVLVGVCGVSGSGKSTLLIDTLGRALAPRTHTTSVAREPLEPGRHDSIDGAPARTVLVDQAKRGIRSPATFLGLGKRLQDIYSGSEDAVALSLDAKSLGRKCSACHGRGSVRTKMGFLPDIREACEVCRGTGYLPEAWEVFLRGVALPEVDSLTLDEVQNVFGDDDRLARSLKAATDVGLGYLVMRQSGFALSGGEAQRLKIAKELSGKARKGALYILDEPTVGQHMEDVSRLAGVLHRLVDDGHSVVVVEHHPHFLASCDWLLELGPGGGPEGGRVIASGTPETLAAGDTLTAPYLREALEVKR